MNQITDTATPRYWPTRPGSTRSRIGCGRTSARPSRRVRGGAGQLSRPPSLRPGDGPAKGYRHGHRERQLTGTFGTETVRVPRARIEDEDGKVTNGGRRRCRVTSG
jgi:hypothetical protein